MYDDDEGWKDEKYWFLYYAIFICVVEYVFLYCLAC